MSNSKEAKVTEDNDHYATLDRIDGKYLRKEISSVLNLDKGLLYTIRELLLRPGQTVRDFLLQDRTRIVRPIVFVIIISLVYSLLRQLLEFEDNYLYYDDSVKTTAMSIFGWVKDHYGYGNLIIGIFIALWIKVLFRKYPYNFYEILVLLCFALGTGMLFLTVFGTVEALTGLKIAQFGSLVFLVYTSWAIGQFFDSRKFSSYLKSLAAYFLGLATYTIGVFIIGDLVDMAIKIL